MSKGLLCFSSSPCSFRPLLVPDFLTQYLQKKLKQSSPIALSAQGNCCHHKCIWIVTKRGSHKACDRDKLAAQPGREGQFRNPHSQPSPAWSPEELSLAEAEWIFGDVMNSTRACNSGRLCRQQPSCLLCSSSQDA